MSASERIRVFRWALHYPEPELIWKGVCTHASRVVTNEMTRTVLRMGGVMRCETRMPHVSDSATFKIVVECDDLRDNSATEVDGVGLWDTARAGSER